MLALLALLAVACTTPPRPPAAAHQPGDELWIVARDAAAPRDAVVPGAPALMVRPTGSTAPPVLTRPERTDVTASVIGPIATIERRKRYAAPTAATDGFVVFTPPPAPARQDFDVRIGSHRLRVLVREHDEAARVQATAMREGRTATLLSADARGRVLAPAATLAPGAPVDLTVTTVGIVPWHDGAYELTVPRATGGDAFATVDVFSGGPIVVVQSPSHAIDARALELNHVQVTLRDPAALRQRDFRLRYRIDPDSTAGTLLVEPDGTSAIVGLVVHPQEERHEPVPLADVSIDWGSTHVSDMRPPAIGTIAAGMPFVVLARAEGAVTGPVRVTARIAGRPRTLTIPLAADAPADGLRALPVLWARALRAQVVAQR